MFRALSRDGFAFYDEPFNPDGMAGTGIDIDDRSAKPDIVAGDVVFCRTKRRYVFHDPVDPPSENAFEGSGHADIALEGRSPGKKAFVRCRDMRVCSQDGTDSTVEHASHQLFIACCLGMEVEQCNAAIGNLFMNCFQNATGGVERAIDRRHVDPAEQRENGDRRAVGQSENGVSLSGSLGRIVAGTNDPLVGIEHRHDFLLPERVIAQRDAIDARVNEFPEKDGSQTAAAGRVFRVGDDEIQRVFFTNRTEPAGNDTASRFADDIADEK